MNTMARVTKSIVLPPATGVYVSLFTPREPPSGSTGKPRYSIVLLYDKKNYAKQLAPLFAAAVEVAEGKWPGKGTKIVEQMRYPIAADGDERYPEDPTFEGKMFVRASSQADERRRPPGVVDRQVKRLIDDEHAYSGCVFKTEVRLFPFDKAGNKGVGVGLNNVQVIAEGERLDGRRAAEDVFETIDEDQDSAESLM